ncbi:hypothetical protein NQ315_000174 [Exocentrus adspersus]|uniref:Ciliogenesis-associated TTC17-interacting protein N-terminal domain-containing protein n=1 Tax=Exocentrus adspersus TaxID=1586481 RepID=A0AAV8VQ17_9CUCU|nr:hypothetical protein NQ315_000174 [Exocentrus adspersus]
MYRDLVPETLEDTILSYLRDQEVYCGEAYDETVDVKSFTAEEEVKDILHDLVVKVNKRIACKDRYDNLKLWHHQYPLFNLEDFIPDFCIDEEMLRKLAFRENLFISELDSLSEPGKAEPKPVGGLCLDIQVVDGHQLIDRDIPSDNEVDLQVFKILQRVKTVTDQKPTVQLTDVEKEVQAKLQEYEQFLKNEMSSNTKKFLVHFSSQFDCQGSNGGSTITAWVDRYFHTLEEKRTEFLRCSSDPLEKSLYTSIQNKKYYTRHTCNHLDLDVRRYYPFTVTKNMVLEGANFLLLRYLAITKYVGIFELSTQYIDGSMCRNIYECIGPRKGKVNGKKIDVCKIYRYVIEECGIEHHGVTALTVYGRIITHEWDSCNYMLNINPLLHVNNKTPAAYERMTLTETWKQDLQLMSNYLDCKTLVEREMNTYLTDHPEIKEMISDYVQNVLLIKPENILNFTKHYFQNLYPCNTPRIPYLDSESGPVCDKQMDDVNF